MQLKTAQLFQVESGVPEGQPKQETPVEERIRIGLTRALELGQGEAVKKNILPIIDKLLPQGSNRVLTFSKPDGSEPQAIRLSDTAAIDQAIDEGKIPLKVETGLSAFEQRTRGEARQAARESVGTVSSAIGLLDDVRTLGRGATGLRRVVGQGLGGLVGQFDGELGRTITEFVTNTNPQRLADLRTRASALIANSIATLTGEEERISDTERRIADEALQLNQALSTPESVEGAVFALVRLNIVNAERKSIESGKPPLFGAGTEAGDRATIRKLTAAFPTLANTQMAQLLRDLRQQNRETRLIEGVLSNGG